MPRDRSISLIVGNKGSGKSTLARYLAACAREAKQAVRILDPGRPDFPKDPEASVRRLLSEQWRGLLWCDDADRFIPKDLPDADEQPNNAWRALALRNRHHGIDLLLTARRPSNLPTLLLSGVDTAYLFRVSALDAAAVQALRSAFPGVVIPTEPYRFVVVDTNDPAAGRPQGETRADGSVVLLPG